MLNRDAGLLFYDPEIAAYFERIFAPSACSIPTIPDGTIPRRGDPRRGDP
ncbi:MAG TPA: hypothetical protein VHA35_03600 [Dongiaceae bacterium]|nr:hypothetical protein [Dongiaceae bacterium]